MKLYINLQAICNNKWFFLCFFTTMIWDQAKNKNVLIILFPDKNVRYSISLNEQGGRDYEKCASLCSYTLNTQLMKAEINEHFV